MYPDSSSTLREMIHNSMKLRDTDELLDIWITNDREDWTDEAFVDFFTL
jgi:hypothetical protein